MIPKILKPPFSKVAASNSQGDSGSGQWQEVQASPSTPIAPKLSFNIGSSSQNGSNHTPSEKKQTAFPKTYGSKTKSDKPVSSASFENSTGKYGPHISKKLIDSSFHWVDNGMDLMQDQSDFLVVGVLGMQGVGKSTVMTMLANHKFDESNKFAAFRKQASEVKERGANQTFGVDFTVTAERMILVDSQPLLSPALLEQLCADRKGDYNQHQTIQMQSLQLATFMLTVCHVVIVVQDYFTDPSLYAFLEKAEMLKPPTAPTPPATHDINGAPIQHPVTSWSANRGDATQLQPVVVFVHNKLESDMFSIRSLAAMNAIMSSHTSCSSMYCKGHFSLANCGLYPGLGSLLETGEEVNHFVFPNLLDEERSEDLSDVKKCSIDNSDQHFMSLPKFKNTPGVELLSETFVRMIQSIRRHSLTHMTLTEKNWFHFAARTWEATKKSQTISEFFQANNTR